MLWILHHLCLFIACFGFNCYHPWSSLILRNGNGMSSILHSREVVMQGGPLAMVAYGVGVLPLIKNLKAAHPDVTQTCYAEDVEALGTFVKIGGFFNSLTQAGPEHGYYPVPTKSVLTLHLDNIEAGISFGARHGFKV